MDPTIRLDQLPNHPPGNPGLPNAPAIRLEAITGRTTAHAGEATMTEILLRIIGGGQPVGGARVPLIGNVIQNQFLQARDWPFGAALGVALLGLFLVSQLVLRALRPRGAHRG